MCLLYNRESGGDISKQDLEKIEAHEETLRVREKKRLEQMHAIEEIERDISTNAHIPIIEQLKQTSEKLNLDTNSPVDEVSTYAQLGQLGMDVDGETWRLDSGGDKIAKAFTQSHVNLQSIRRKMDDLRKDSSSKQNTVEGIGYDRLDVINKIKGLEKNADGIIKWSDKSKQMKVLIEGLNEAGSLL